MTTLADHPLNVIFFGPDMAQRLAEGTFSHEDAKTFFEFFAMSDVKKAERKTALATAQSQMLPTEQLRADDANSPHGLLAANVALEKRNETLALQKYWMQEMLPMFLENKPAFWAMIKAVVQYEVEKNKKVVWREGTACTSHMVRLWLYHTEAFPRLDVSALYESVHEWLFDESDHKKKSKNKLAHHLGDSFERTATSEILNTSKPRIDFAAYLQARLHLDANNIPEEIFQLFRDHLSPALAEQDDPEAYINIFIFNLISLLYQEDFTNQLLRYLALHNETMTEMDVNTLQSGLNKLVLSPLVKASVAHSEGLRDILVQKISTPINILKLKNKYSLDLKEHLTDQSLAFCTALFDALGQMAKVSEAQVTQIKRAKNAMLDIQVKSLEDLKKKIYGTDGKALPEDDMTWLAIKTIHCATTLRKASRHRLGDTEVIVTDAVFERFRDELNELQHNIGFNMELIGNASFSKEALNLIERFATILFYAAAAKNAVAFRLTPLEALLKAKENQETEFHFNEHASRLYFSREPALTKPRSRSAGDVFDASKTTGYPQTVTFIKSARSMESVSGGEASTSSALPNNAPLPHKKAGKALSMAGTTGS